MSDLPLGPAPAFPPANLASSRHPPAGLLSSLASNPTSSPFPDTAAASSTSSRASRDTASSDKRTMLSRALQQATTAVVLDNAQNFDAAIDAYSDACQLLQTVMDRSSSDDDKRKLVTIQIMYDNRIHELEQQRRALQSSPDAGNSKSRARDSLRSQMSAGLASKTQSKDMAGPSTVAVGLPSGEPTSSSSVHPQSFNHLHNVATIEKFLSPGHLGQGPKRKSAASKPVRNFSVDLSHPSNAIHNLSRPHSRPGDTSDSAQSPPEPSAASLQGHKRLESSPSAPRSTVTRPKSRDPAGASTTSGPTLNVPTSRAVDEHGRKPSSGSTSWLDTIGESAHSVRSSRRSQSTTRHPVPPHLLPRPVVADSHAEFHTAFDAAIDAAYDGDDLSTAHVPDEVTNRSSGSSVDLSPLTHSIEHPSGRGFERQTGWRKPPNNTPSYDLSPGPSNTHPSSALLPSLSVDHKSPDSAIPTDSDPSSALSQPQFFTQTFSSYFTGESPALAQSNGASTAASSVQQGDQISHRARPFSSREAVESYVEDAVAETADDRSRPECQFAVNFGSDAGTRSSGNVSGGVVPTAGVTNLAHPESNAGSALPASGRSSLGHHPDSPSVSAGSELSQDKSSHDSGKKKASPNGAHNRVTSFSRRSSRRSRPPLATIQPGSHHSAQPAAAAGSHSFSLFPGRRPTILGVLDGEHPHPDILFEADIHSLSVPGTPSVGLVNSPLPLEACPDSFLLRPYWLMRSLYQTMVHPRGGYLSTRLFVPRDVWRVRGVRIRCLDEKVASCDLLTAALRKIATVDTFDADAVLEEMQALELVLDTVQSNLSKKLGTDVGVQGAHALWKDHFPDTEPNSGGSSGKMNGHGSHTSAPFSSTLSSSMSLSKSGSQARSYFSSFRKLRNRSGPGASSGLANLSKDAMSSSAAVSTRDGLPATHSTVPMTSSAKSRYSKIDVSKADLSGPNAGYVGSLARLFDAVQVVEQVTRQAEDPGLRHSSPTHVGIELCSRHAAEFFAFFVCRFVIADLSAFLDKFIKRGSEWAGV